MNSKLKRLYAVSAIIFIALWCIVALPPFAKLIDRIDPFILGMPFVQFFYLMIPLLMAIWLIVWYNLEVKIQDAEDAKDEKAKQDAAPAVASQTKGERNE
jgi:hypothetical protein